jgi:hypothetical protein
MRRFYFAFLGLLASTASQAQSSLKFGLRASMNASTYQGKEVPDPGYRFGPAVGLLVRLPLSTHVSLQPELLVEQHGASTDLHVEGPYGYYSHSVVFSQQTRSRLRYLSLPLLVRGQAGNWFAVAGPQVSYLLSAKERVTTLVDDPYTFDLVHPFTGTRRGTDNYLRWSVGGVVGVGYQVLPHLAVELRYAAAVTKVHQSASELRYTTPFWPERLWNARTSSLQAQLSYVFNTQSQ